MTTSTDRKERKRSHATPAGLAATALEAWANLFLAHPEGEQAVQGSSLELRPSEDEADDLKRLLARIRASARRQGGQVTVRQVDADLFVTYDVKGPESHVVGQLVAAKERMRDRVLRGELLDTGKFAEARGITRQAVSKAVQAKRLFYVEVEGAQHFPSFYLDSSIERRHLELVTRELGDLPGTSKLQFFLNAKGSLGGRTPLEALAEGRLDDVRATARGFAGN